jgi:TolA-binding protein
MSPRLVKPLTIIWLAPLWIGLAFGQGKGSAPPAGGNGGPGGSAGAGGIGNTGTVGRTPSNLPNGNTNPNPSTTPNIPQPIFLSGRVVVDDGSPLPEPATIIRVCNGNPRSEGYTDAQGNFGIELGNELGVMQDASEGHGLDGGVDSGMGGMAGMPGMPTNASGGAGNMPVANSNSTVNTMADRRLLNCELQARLAGYRSQSVMLVNRRPLDDPDVGTILLHRLTKAEEGNTVSARSLAAPKDARKAFDKGLENIKKSKFDDAFREFQKAVMLYPSYSTAWCELGKLEVARGQTDIARGSFNEALKADPKYVDPYLQLSLLALNAKNWTELADFTGKAIALDSFDYPQEFLFSAVAHYNLHEFDSAEKSILRAETLDTHHAFPQIAYLKGLVQIQHKDYTGAAANLRAYLKLAPNAEDAPKVREQLTQLEKYISQTAVR